MFTNVTNYVTYFSLKTYSWYSKARLVSALFCTVWILILSSKNFEFLVFLFRNNFDIIGIVAGTLMNWGGYCSTSATLTVVFVQAPSVRALCMPRLYTHLSSQRQPLAFWERVIHLVTQRVLNKCCGKKGTAYW